MRIALFLSLVALAGCATIRQGLGEYQKTADKGIQVGTAAAAETAPDAEPGKAVLPGGLGGDKANAAYTSPPPQD